METIDEKQVLDDSVVGITIGVDLGKHHDYSAFAVAENRINKAKDGVFIFRHLERAKLGTDYTRVADRLQELHDGIVREVEQTNVIRKRTRGKPETISAPEVYLDATGLGSPFLDFFVKHHGNVHVNAVTITSGDKETEVKEYKAYAQLHVGKSALVNRMQLLLGTKRLDIPNTSEGKELAHELKVFEGRVTASRNVSYNAKEGEHDDLLIAAALAVWQQARTLMDRVGVYLG